MLTKKNMWFVTLFSIILVMAVYYVSVPSNEETKTVSVDNTSKNDISVTMNEESNITALRVSRDDTLLKETEAIKEILLDDEKTTQEKNDAYEALKKINTNKGLEESFESKIKSNFNYDNFVSIDGNNVKVVVDTKDHSYELANKIIQTIQKDSNTNYYISVSFNSK